MKKGFTLIELLILITIVGVLLAIGIPFFAKKKAVKAGTIVQVQEKGRTLERPAIVSFGEISLSADNLHTTKTNICTADMNGDGKPDIIICNYDKIIIIENKMEAYAH